MREPDASTFDDLMAPAPRARAESVVDADVRPAKPAAKPKNEREGRANAKRWYILGALALGAFAVAAYLVMPSRPTAEAKRGDPRVEQIMAAATAAPSPAPAPAPAPATAEAVGPAPADAPAAPAIAEAAVPASATPASAPSAPLVVMAVLADGVVVAPKGDEAAATVLRVGDTFSAGAK